MKLARQTEWFKMNYSGNIKNLVDYRIVLESKGSYF